MVTRRAFAYLVQSGQPEATRTLLILIRATKHVSIKDEYESFANTDTMDVSVDLNDTLVEGEGHLYVHDNNCSAVGLQLPSITSYASAKDRGQPLSRTSLMG